VMGGHLLEGLGGLLWGRRDVICWKPIILGLLCEW
jgi:hypothetical protein